jgi:hypothetical protein
LLPTNTAKSDTNQPNHSLKKLSTGQFKMTTENKITNINEMLAGREARYGTFEGHANISQTIKDDMRNHPGWERLVSDQREALEMIAHKIARILNGDPNYADNWVDLGGYPTLVANRLEKEDNAQ